MSKIKYVVVILIGMFIILEFFTFPSLSDQIRHDKFIYPQMIEDKKIDMLESIKVNENVFVGSWMMERSINVVFNSDGTGTMYNNHGSTPFTYSYTGTTITITGLSYWDGDLIASKYNYELDSNILIFKMDSHKTKYLIKQ